MHEVSVKSTLPGNGDTFFWRSRLFMLGNTTHRCSREGKKIVHYDGGLADALD
jgi:hypothetical protein